MTRMVVPVSLLPRALVLASTQLGVWRQASSEIPSGVVVQVKSDPNCFNYSGSACCIRSAGGFELRFFSLPCTDATSLQAWQSISQLVTHHKKDIIIRCRFKVQRDPNDFPRIVPPIDMDWQPRLERVNLADHRRSGTPPP